MVWCGVFEGCELGFWNGEVGAGVVNPRPWREKGFLIGSGWNPVEHGSYPLVLNRQNFIYTL